MLRYREDALQYARIWVWKFLAGKKIKEGMKNKTTLVKVASFGILTCLRLYNKPFLKGELLVEEFTENGFCERELNFDYSPILRDYLIYVRGNDTFNGAHTALAKKYKCSTTTMAAYFNKEAESFIRKYKLNVKV